jgi:hypothetical protein
MFIFLDKIFYGRKVKIVKPKRAPVLRAKPAVTPAEKKQAAYQTSFL